MEAASPGQPAGPLLYWRRSCYARQLWEGPGKCFVLRIKDLHRPGLNPFSLDLDAGAGSLRDVAEILYEAVGDVDGDGAVGVSDILSVIGNWSPNGGDCCPGCEGDVDGDLAVDVADILIIVGAWGACQ